MKTYLTLEKSITHKSNHDGSLYKSYITSFFSYSKSHHTINDFYDQEGNVYIPETVYIYESKKDPDTNEIFVRAEVEFEGDMDFLLNKPLYFKEPEWFHDLTNEKINKIVYSFSDWDICDLIDDKTAIRNLRLKALLSPVPAKTDFQPIHAVHVSSTDICIHSLLRTPEVPVSTCVRLSPVPMCLTVQYICLNLIHA